MGKRIKMVFVTQNLAPFRVQWLDELSKYIDICIFHLNDYDSTVNEKYLEFNQKNLKIRTEFIYIGNKKFFRVKEILNEKADIYVLDGYGFIGQVALIAYFGMFNIPFYMSVDGGFVPKKENKIKRIIKEFCINRPKGFFSTSEVTDIFLSAYLKKKTPIYRHYFSSVYKDDICKKTDTEKDYFRKKLGLKNKFIVIAVGQFIYRKGFDILLRAAETSPGDICFVFIGGKPTEEYNILVEKVAPESIRFVDFLNKEELREYYFAGDVFAMPSREDVWGLVVGEAMACGLPVISSDTCIAAVSMIKDYENGFIINNENPKNWLKKISELKENSEMQNRMADNNCRLMEKYAIENSAINDIETIKKILWENIR